MARTGKDWLTADYPTFTKSMLDVKFREAGVRASRAEAGEFELEPTHCAYLCSVAAWCPAKDPDMADVVRLPMPTVRQG
jgi:hypothetical protein